MLSKTGYGGGDMLKRIIILICVVLLAGCAPKTVKEASEQITEQFRNVTVCTMDAEISADFGDRVSVFTVRYTQTAAETGTITILTPSEIAGITAQFAEGSSAVTFDDVTLETGKLAGTALTPIDAIPTMMRTWADGLLSETTLETLEGAKCYRLTYEIPDSNILQNAWFAVDTLVPVFAETLVDGQRVISCKFSAVSLT